ncbi:hypothetical protein SAMN03159496_05516 [Rhizobium sp. NFR07]|uniref:hypothetical protein n=1 Tax=Rhizobium sp. NFR07 TaxID=1566262 RepID=UPI0008F0C514|nr:hypothetical protein [Rhizobium sp. NFR07]SFB59372.1 hypothetical protein SAMN03159496_05516 [Rhizobium sp. NFR07]
MGKKLFSVYDVLVQGVGQGLSGYELYNFVMGRCKASSNKRICRASLLAMSDAPFLDRNALEGIYSIATDQRMRCSG